MFKFNVYKPLLALVVTAAVSACGGSSSGDNGSGGSPGSAAPATTDVPAAALSSVDGLLAYINQLIDSGSNDTSEPIFLGDASLPVDDTI